MIEDIEEKDYRALKFNSSSSLKDFSTDRRKYYRRHILGEIIKEKPDKASNMGRIVETLLMEPHRFDDEFFMSSLVTVPGGMLGDFIWNLSEEVGKFSGGDEYIADHLDDGVFEAFARKAYTKAGFKIKFETVIKKLDDPNNGLYYKECLQVNASNMTMVTPQDITNAEQIVAELKSNPITSTIVNLETNEEYSVYNQLKIVDFKVCGMSCKSMLDKLIVDHKKKEVIIYDLKCTWSVESFYREYYLFRKAFIQAFVYYRAVCDLSSDPSSEFYGYKVLPTKFIVCDSINYYSPLIYELSEADLMEAEEGFTYNGREYVGVRQIVEDLSWALISDRWTISRKNLNKHGVLNIKDKS